MKGFYLKILALGEDNYHDEFDRRRVRLFNFLIFWFSILIFPYVTVVSLILDNPEEFYSTLFIQTVILSGLYFNHKGYTQQAIIGTVLISFGVIGYVLYHIPHQTGAPYSNLLIALASVLLVKARAIRLTLLTLAIASFMVTNYIQLKYKSFDDTEYGPIIAVLFLFFLSILYYDKLMVSYQRKILKQGEVLLRLEDEKHQREMELKQKDLEMMLASASARDQLTENLTVKLREIAKLDNVQKEIFRVIRELNSQSELINKQSLIHRNIDELNAEFHERLLTQFPDLTRSERELSAFLKLSLTNKEIAAIKNSTENSVNVSKARLRRKLGLETNKDLSAFLLNF